MSIVLVDREYAQDADWHSFRQGRLAGREGSRRVRPQRMDTRQDHGSECFHQSAPTARVRLEKLRMPEVRQFNASGVPTVHHVVSTAAFVGISRKPL